MRSEAEIRKKIEKVEQELKKYGKYFPIEVITYYVGIKEALEWVLENERVKTL